MDQKKGKKARRREDVRSQIRVSEDTTTEQARQGREDFMKQMMDYQYHEQ